MRLGKAPFQGGECRTLAGNDPAARQIGHQEFADVLLDRDATDVQEDGYRQFERERRQRAEGLRVDAACPQGHVLDAVAAQFIGDRRRRRQDDRRVAVKSAQSRVGRRLRYAVHRAQELREPRVIGPC